MQINSRAVFTSNYAVIVDKNIPEILPLQSETATLSREEFLKAREALLKAREEYQVTKQEEYGQPVELVHAGTRITVVQEAALLLPSEEEFLAAFEGSVVTPAAPAPVPPTPPSDGGNGHGAIDSPGDAASAAHAAAHAAGTAHEHP
jgi:hypothetical protein